MTNTNKHALNELYSYKPNTTKIKTPNLPLPKAALIQLILFAILFFLNIYSFFIEDGVELITIIITIIVVVSMILGIAAFWVNRKQLFKDKKVNTLEIASLVSLGLLTLISILSSFSALVVWIVVGDLGLAANRQP